MTMAKKEFALLRRTHPTLKGGKVVDETQEFQVEVMARAKGYAMVRRPGAMPFVEREKDLHSLPVEIKKGD